MSSFQNKLAGLVLQKLSEAVAEAREIAIILAEKDARLQLGEGATEAEIEELSRKIIDKLQEDPRVAKAIEKAGNGVIIDGGAL